MSDVAGVQTISASEFKAKCLELLDKLADHSLERLVVTKRGRPVAVLTPPDSKPPFRFEDLYGSMKGMVSVPPDLDLTEPLLDPDDIAAMQGILHY